MKKGDEFQCAQCGGVFTAAWDDIEAIKEKEGLFPATPMEDCCVICDDCFQGIRKRMDR